MPTAKETNAVKSTIMALSVSAIKVIPKGACQPPNCKVRYPFVNVISNKRKHNINAILFPTMLITFCTKTFCQKNNKRIAVNKCINTGASIKFVVIYLNLEYLMNPNHQIRWWYIPFLATQWQMPLMQN